MITGYSPWRRFRQLKPMGAASALVLGALWAQAQSNEFRGLWVDAWGAGFINASQVSQLIADCRAYNFNAIVVQMRRRGDAFYTPGIPGNDPKTTAIASSFDALADLLAKAHSGSPRLEVHCWVTTFLVWSDSANPPSQPGHVYNLHPEYLTKDSTGQTFISEGAYLDPGNPEATLWNYVMATNIVRRYDLDGFHWDYIRYPTTDSGFNPVAIARYNAEFGLAGQPSPSDPQFAAWRRRQVTDFLRWVNADLLAIRSNLVISCSVFGSRSDAYNARFQDWAAWNNEGILDICMPMGYTSDNALFTARVDDAFNHQGQRRVYSGQGAYLNTKENTVWQLDYIRAKPLLGSMLYSYRTPNSGTVAQAATLAFIRDNHQPTSVYPPAIPWKTTPTQGLLKGSIARADTGAPLFNATVQLFSFPSRTQKTEAHGKYAFFDATPGTYTITATATGMGAVTNTVTVSAGAVVVRDLVVPATDNSPPVISNIAVDEVTDRSAKISWQTDEDADSVVEYGPTASYGAALSNGVLTIYHVLDLSGLTPNLTYHFRVRSRNPAGLQSASGDQTLLTNPSGVVSDIVIDDADPEARTVGAWTMSSTSPGYWGTGYRYDGLGTGAEYVEFRPNLLTAGDYQVYAWYVQGGNRTPNAPHIIRHRNGSTTRFLNQQTGGSQWNSLGTYSFNAGTNGYVRVSDGFTGGNVVMADAIKFVYVPPPPPPVITNQPQSKTVKQGTSASFTVGATGGAPLSYRWRFDGDPLAGATASTLAIANAQPSNEGEYSVVVTNLSGSVTSAPAFLLVTIPPYIATQPLSQSVRQGEDALFTVSAAGSEPFLYQWRFEGTNLAGATQSIYTRTHALTNHAGLYSVVVSNAAGSVLSANASLFVTLPVPPQFQSLELLADGRARLVLSSDAGFPCVIEASSNLSAWFELMNVLSTNSFLDLTDDSASNAPLRFYRARQ